jgi:hypothetical protein
MRTPREATIPARLIGLTSKLRMQESRPPTNRMAKSTSRIRDAVAVVVGSIQLVIAQDARAKAPRLANRAAFLLIGSK